MIFVDTGAFLARYLANDARHLDARRGWAELAEASVRLFTSGPVLAETFTLLGRRSSHAFAAARAREVFASQALAILRPGADEEWEALESFEKLADQAVSFTDCLSFALMSQRRISLAFTFDRHFRHAGFETWPQPR